MSIKTLRSLLEEATSGIFTWKPDCDKVDWSSKFFQTLGHTVDQIENYSSFEHILHPDDYLLMREALNESRMLNSLYQVKLRIMDANGIYRKFDVKGVWEKDSTGKERLVGFLTDITAVENAKKETKRANALLSAFFDHAPAAVYLKTKEHKHLYCNDTAADLMGTTVEELLNETSDNTFTEEVATKYAESDDYVLKTKKPFVWTGEIETKSGQQLHIIDSKFPVEHPETGEMMIGGFGIDITRQHKAEKALSQSQKLEAVGQLVAGVAHDFNNTLGVVQGNLELLQLQKDRNKSISFLLNALRAVDRGTRLTKQLLAFARKSPLDITTVSLNELVQNMDRLLRSTLPESIKIETVCGGGLWNTNIDIAQAENAILNLALNARDAMPDGGKLTIETSNFRLGPEYVEERKEEIKPGRYVLLAITDTGLGMSEETLRRAFEPFYTTKPVDKGTGMGLSMVYGLMRQFSGAVRIYSEEGVGTTIKLFFPASVEQKDAVGAEPRALVRGGTERVLLVEDDKDLRHTVEEQMKVLGYAVTIAENGDEAMELLHEGLMVDLLVTDVVMPGNLMGPQLAKKVRDNAPETPVMFMSGYPAEANIHGNGLRPEDIILLKPITFENLSYEMRRALDVAKDE